MRDTLLEALRCPFCGSRLAVVDNAAVLGPNGSTMALEEFATAETCAGRGETHQTPVRIKRREQAAPRWDPNGSAVVYCGTCQGPPFGAASPSTVADAEGVR